MASLDKTPTLRYYDGEGELGGDGYPLEWHRTIKHDVRAAAGNRCVRCGHPYKNGEHGNGEHSPCDDRCTHDPDVVTWRILTVHHLDRDKANCRWWNLAALCQRCHLTIQGKVYLEREFIREHSAWFKPYAAGWYAHRYLGEELTREEAEARLEELLDLEFRQPALFGGDPVG